MSARGGAVLRGLSLGVAIVALTACTRSGDAEVASADVALADNGAAIASAVAADVPPAAMATAALRSADGRDVGTVTASAVRGGVAFTVDGRMLPTGLHGIHIHTVGLCEGPKFVSAGGHWNPTARMHGKENPMGPHLGDLPNLTIGAGGTGTVSFTVPGATLGGLMDADGAAFMVHAAADDYKTDPAGASGDRIACGVFAPA